MAKKTDGKYTILVVDDDTDILETMATAVQETEQKVLTARDGQEAMALIEAEDPDIVVLDIMLPHRGGFQVLQRLKGKRDMKGKRPLVCMVTGKGGMRHQQFAQQLGGDDFLMKPFALGRLVDIVRGYIQVLEGGAEKAK